MDAWNVCRDSGGAFLSLVVGALLGCLLTWALLGHSRWLRSKQEWYSGGHCRCCEHAGWAEPGLGEAKKCSCLCHDLGKHLKPTSIAERQ